MTPLTWPVVRLALAATLVVQLACAQMSPASAPTDTPAPTAAPTLAPTPTPTPIPAPTDTPPATRAAPPATGASASPVIPVADLEGTRALLDLLSAVPEGFRTALYLDVRAVREDPALRSIGDLDVPRFLAALPPGTLSLIDHVVAGVGPNPQEVLIAIQGPIDVEGLLEVAIAYGGSQQSIQRETYKGYSISRVDLSGMVLAGAAVSDSISMLALGAPPGLQVSEGPISVGVKAAIDSYDGTAPGMADDPHVSSLLEFLPSGITASVTSTCTVTVAAAGGPSPLACRATGFSITPTDPGVFNLNGAAAFDGEGGAAEALERLGEGLVVGGVRAANVAARQEGSLLLLSLSADEDELARMLGGNVGFQIGPTP